MADRKTQPETWTVELGERAQDKRPLVPLNIKGPASIDVRLDQLCDMCDKAGRARPSRDLLVCALIFSAEENLDTLEALLIHYRDSTHSQVLLGTHPVTGELDLSDVKDQAVGR